MKLINNLYKQLQNKQGLVHFLGAGFIGKVIAFGSNFIIVRMLTKEAYNIFVYSNNIYSFIYLFSALGLVSGLLQVCSENYKDKQKSEQLFSVGFFCSVLINFTLGLLLLIYAFLNYSHMTDTRNALICFAFMPLTTVIVELIQTNLRCSIKTESYAKFSIINSVLMLVLSTLGAASFSLYGVIVGNILASVLSIIYAFKYLDILLEYKLDVFSASICKEVIDLFKISVHSMFNIGMSQLVNIIDLFLIGVFLADNVSLAVYRVAGMIPNALIFIASSLMMFVYPYFVANRFNTTWVRSNSLKLFLYFGLFNLCLVSFLNVFSINVVTLFFGEQYTASVDAFRILCISYFFSATFRKVVGNILVTQRKLSINFGISLFELITTIIVNVIFIPKWGILGAAYANLLVVLSSAIISFSFFMYYLEKMRSQ